MTVAYADLFDYAVQPVTATACPLCGQDNPSRPTVDRYGYRVGVSQCRCGLIYLNPRMNAAQYARFYEEAYRPLVSRVAQRDTSGEQADENARGRAGWIATRIAPWLPRPVRSVLDVGGGRGAAALALGEALGAETVTVVDPNAQELAVARARGCRTIEGAAESIPTDTTYDLIVCLQTADHWLDPMAALRAMRAVCAGLLWIDFIDVHVRAKLRPWKIDHPLYWSRLAAVRALVGSGWRPRGVCFPSDVRGRMPHRPNFLCEGA